MRAVAGKYADGCALFCFSQREYRFKQSVETTNPNVSPALSKKFGLQSLGGEGETLPLRNIVALLTAVRNSPCFFTSAPRFIVRRTRFGASPHAGARRVSSRLCKHKRHPLRDAFCIGGEGETRTPAPVTRPTPLAGAPRHQLEYFSIGSVFSLIELYIQSGCFKS